MAGAAVGSRVRTGYRLLEGYYGPTRPALRCFKGTGYGGSHIKDDWSGVSIASEYCRNSCDTNVTTVQRGVTAQERAEEVEMLRLESERNRELEQMSDPESAWRGGQTFAALDGISRNL